MMMSVIWILFVWSPLSPSTSLFDDVSPLSPTFRNEPGLSTASTWTRWRVLWSTLWELNKTLWKVKNTKLFTQISNAAIFHFTPCYYGVFLAHVWFAGSSYAQPSHPRRHNIPSTICGNATCTSHRQAGASSCIAVSFLINLEMKTNVIFGFGIEACRDPGFGEISLI